MSGHTSFSLTCEGLDRATLVLIASAGHSGSTLLDLLLGNHPDVSSAGEMNRLTLFPEDRVCACGAVVTECEYWTAVRVALSRAAGRASPILWQECRSDVPPQPPLLDLDIPDLDLGAGAPVPVVLRDRMREAGIAVADDATLARKGRRDFKWTVVSAGQPTLVLRRECGRVQVYPETLAWKDALRLVPDPLELALALGSRGAVTAVGRMFPPAARTIEAAVNSWHIADAMVTVDRTRYVVDSSKSPVRLKLLFMLHPDRVRVLHLVRDGRAVSASAMRRTRLSVTQAAKTWKRDNQNLNVMLRTVAREQVHKVSYEALCEDPASALAEICRFLDLAFSPSLLTLWNRPVHNIPGNPMLFDRSRTTIRKDERWRRDLSPADLSTFDRIAGDTNRALGYA